MLLTRDTTGEVTQRIFDDPNVGQGPIDITPLLRDSHCIALVGDPPLGVHIGLQVVSGVYEVHSVILPEGRGEWAVEFTESAIRHIFVTTDCIELITRIPHGALPPNSLARRFGFAERWVGGDMVYQNRIVPFSVWSLTLMGWMPAEIEAFNAVIAEMREAGQDLKADVWFARRAFVARKIDA